MIVRPSSVYEACDRSGASGRAITLTPNDSRLLTLGLSGAAAELYDAAAHGTAVDIDDLARRLILDRALEVGHGTTFVSGASALARLWPDDAPQARHSDALSVAALRHAQTFTTADARTLTRKLYAYNRLPLSPTWRRLLPNHQTAVSALGLGPGDRLRATVDRDYRVDEGSVWVRLHRRGGVRVGDAPAKLYVNPMPADLATAVQVAIPCFLARDVRSFKIASSAAGFLRPDKFVAYFELPSEAAETARRLAPLLRERGITPHEVPFTTTITGDPLVSVGYAPPTSAEAAGRQLSWRAWICQQLAGALLIARTDPDRTCEPWEFALRRIQLDGVDTETWTPR